ncbi:MAG: polysaccharide biosynthesis tyrosine autokinase [Hyphomicrobiales bacterium]
MNHISNIQNPGDRGGNQRAIIPGDPANFPDPYRRDSHLYPYYPMDLEVERAPRFDFFKYLRIAIKYRWLIAGTTIAALVLATIITFLKTPIYQTTASIQIEREAMNVVEVGDLQPNEMRTGQDFYQTQYELLGSLSLASRVVSTLGLMDDPAFNQQAAPSLFGMVRQGIGSLFSGSNSEDGGKENSESADALDARAQGAAGKLRLMLGISPVRGSRIVNITISHPNPALAQRLANGYAEVFIADNLDRRYEASSYARKFLEDRLQQLRVRLEESERQLVKYAEQKGIINLDDKKSLAGTDLEAINTRLREARNERIKQELLWKQAQSTDGFGLQQILESPAIQENRKLRAELAATYQEKLALFKPAYPAMTQLRAQIQELDKQAQLEIKAIKDSIQSNYEASKKQEELLVAQLDQTKNEVVDQRNRSIDYTILQREVDTNRTLYDGLLQRYKEIGIAGGVGTNNVSIVDRAALPDSPSSPKLFHNLALALVLGLMLGAAGAVGLDYLDDSFKSPEDIETETGLSVIGIVPRPKPGSSVEEELADPRSGMAEAYRSLRTGLQFSTSEGLPKSLLITSSKPAEGKSTSTVSIARSLASIHLKVLLIDADLRNSSLHKILNLSNEVGLSNYLTGANSPEDVVQLTSYEGVAFISSGPLPPNPAELLSGSKFLSLLTLAAQSFDIVLIDGPPIMGLADAPLLASLSQATLLVVAANETRRSTLKVALKRLQFTRATIIGATLNKFDSRQTGYGYGYGYGYGAYEYHSYGPKQITAKS